MTSSLLLPCSTCRPHLYLPLPFRPYHCPQNSPTAASSVSQQQPTRSGKRPILRPACFPSSSSSAASTNCGPTTTSSCASSASYMSSSFDAANMLIRRIRNTHRVDHDTRQNFMRHYFALRQHSSELRQIRKLESDIVERRFKLQNTIRGTESDLCVLIDTLETRRSVSEKTNTRTRNEILGEVFYNDGMCPTNPPNRGAYLKHLRNRP
ncbi:hypothetical protein BCR43DRAFT_508517 [Syncephalastrum racemosum]|uniref:Uncharacterized protein n=1 Tax=Syncephalastrum racemosum TaxID=13706 RepID=A0A1X2H107_SYNRA|nr:hypothetical protein BCR43DRAFT_508517 [Syncephalastrum racemosum]